MLLATQVSGCFRDVPLEPAAAPPGGDVAVVLNEQGTLELHDVIGPGAHRVDGRLIGGDNGDLLLSVRSVRHFDLPNPVRWSGERVTIPFDFVTGVQQRLVDQKRSLLALGVAVLGAALISTIAIRVGGGGDGDSDTKPEPPPSTS